MLTLVLAAIFVGITIGMLGSGGSAITVPLLVYLVGHDPKVAITESMAIVGLISFFAAIPYATSRRVDWHSVFYFGIPGVIGTYLGAVLGGIASGSMQLAVLGGVLVLAAVLMIRKAFFQNHSSDTAAAESSAEKGPTQSLWKIVLEGLVVGVLTGFVGVGGGFLIVPALVLLARLPIHTAIGTSLVIIAAKSVAGLIKYQQILTDQGMSIDIQTIILFALVGTAASHVGAAVNTKLDQQRLKQVFAVFLVFIGLFVIVRETL